MRKFADFSHGLSKGMTMGKPNRFHLAHSADQGGALRNQVYVGGHFRLEDDEAFVIDVNDGGAAYFTVPISNVWGTTMGIVDRTGSLNKAQSEPNADGTWTYVLANADPGVHNWVDPCGLSEGILTLRMAEFPGQRPAIRYVYWLTRPCFRRRGQHPDGHPRRTVQLTRRAAADVPGMGEQRAGQLLRHRGAGTGRNQRIRRVRAAVQHRGRRRRDRTDRPAAMVRRDPPGRRCERLRVDPAAERASSRPTSRPRWPPGTRPPPTSRPAGRPTTTRR